MDTDANRILLSLHPAPSIYSAAPLRQRNIVLLRHQQLSMKFQRLQFCCHPTRKDTIVIVFKKMSVRTAFADRVLTMTIVDEDFHSAVR